MLGHSAVYYADMRSLIIFGGFVPESARRSDRSNKLLAFHLDLQVGSELSITANSGVVPRGRSFHSAVLVGDYVVIYGKIWGVYYLLAMDSRAESERATRIYNHFELKHYVVKMILKTVKLLLPV